LYSFILCFVCFFFPCEAMLASRFFPPRNHSIIFLIPTSVISSPFGGLLPEYPPLCLSLLTLFPPDSHVLKPVFCKGQCRNSPSFRTYKLKSWQYPSRLPPNPYFLRPLPPFIFFVSASSKGPTRPPWLLNADIYVPSITRVLSLALYCCESLSRPFCFASHFFQLLTPLNTPPSLSHSFISGPSWGCRVPTVNSLNTTTSNVHHLLGFSHKDSNV